MELLLANEQSQKLLLSAQMRQSLHILGMSMQDLTQFFTQAATDNPLLELLPPENEDTNENSSDCTERIDASELQDDDTETEYWSGSGRQIPMEAFGVKQERFSDLLREQLIGKKQEIGVLRCCSVLIDCLDQRGYLGGDWMEAAKAAGFGLCTARSALAVLQSLEPAGVGARSLMECLLLQLALQARFDTNAANLVRSGLALLAKNDLKGIMRLLGTDRKEAMRCCEAVRALNPIPARGYDTGETICYVIPDAVIREEPDGLRVSLNHAYIPRLGISDEFSLLAETPVDEIAKSFVSQRTKEARFLIRALEDRNKTVLRVVRSIARMQSCYLQTGGVPAAMTLREIAEETGLHISTVSRAIKDKYLLCRQGTVPIKTLFSSGIRSGTDAVITPAMICRQIDALIRAENAASPFSDEDLKRELVLSGFCVSRRTIAKYRISMGIPASQTRMRA